jgi:hypothetical protein
MSLRRGRQSPDPEKERKLSRERSGHGKNIGMEREIQNLHARMEDMEAA